MVKRSYKSEEVVAKLRQADVLHSQGMTIADAVREIGVSEVTFYRTLGTRVLLAVELDALFDGDEADLAMGQRFHDLDHLPAVGDGFQGSVQ